MRFLRIQGLGGASGDMLLAALIDLGIEPDALQTRVAGLPVEPFSIAASAFASHGLHGTQVEVRLGPAHGHDHDHGHGHGHGPAHGTGHAHAHEHRTFADIRHMIDHAPLPERVRRLAVDVFRKLAEAEGSVHGCPPEAVHFHEVGAVDSIVDIVGACLALDLLNIERVAVDPLPLGRGTVVCAHGRYPVPAPATAELLRGFPVEADGEEGEMVTPTGAALLMGWRALGTPPSSGRLLAVGQGFGHRRYEGRPNVLRALLFESGPESAEPAECLLLETQIDDCTGEAVGTLCERLMEAGSLDAWCTPVQMKQWRPGVQVSALCTTDKRDALLDLFFRESTTLGVREQPVRRTTLPRRIESVPTPWGDVRVKIASWRDAVVTRAPEWRDCVTLGKANGLPARTVYEAAQRSAASAVPTGDAS